MSVYCHDKLLFGPLVIQLVWYILKQLFTSVLVNVVDICWAAKRWIIVNFFSRLGPLPTFIRHENATFRKRSTNRRYLKTPAFCFLMDGYTLKTELYETTSDVTIITWFPWASFPATQIHNDRWWCHFQWDLCFQFPPRSVDEALLKKFTHTEFHVLLFLVYITHPGCQVTNDN